MTLQAVRPLSLGGELTRELVCPNPQVLECTQQADLRRDATCGTPAQYGVSKHISSVQWDTTAYAWFCTV